uniref:Uncharacterized protein n=1 Tax=Oryza nivara TaxID=4536 RepID=A0A0E0G3N0_ORYNI
MALPEQPLPCPERPASGAAAAARPSRHLHPPSRRPPRRFGSLLPISGGRAPLRRLLCKPRSSREERLSSEGGNEPSSLL